MAIEVVLPRLNSYNKITTTAHLLFLKVLTLFLMTLFQNLVIFAFLNLKSKFLRRIRSPIKINIRYLKTSSQKYNRKDYNQLQNLVIFNFMFITGFWH